MVRFNYLVLAVDMYETIESSWYSPASIIDFGICLYLQIRCSQKACALLELLVLNWIVKINNDGSPSRLTTTTRGRYLLNNEWLVFKWSENCTFSYYVIGLQYHSIIYNNTWYHHMNSSHQLAASSETMKEAAKYCIAALNKRDNLGHTPVLLICCFKKSK